MPAMSLLIKPASSLCNMRCKYCFYADVAENREVKNYGMMSEKTLEEMVKKALSYAEGQCTFAFQGGEPTMEGLEYYRRLVELQVKYNVNKVAIYNSIQTNGLVVDEAWAEFFAKNKFLVGLSVDGPKDIHDSFRVDSAGGGTHNRVMQTVNLFNKYGVEYNVLCVVNNYVARHGSKVYKFFRQKGFRYLQFIPCIDAFDDDESHDYSLTAERYGEFLKTTFDEYYFDMKNGNYTSVRTFDAYIEMLLGRRPGTCGMSGVCTSYYVVEGDGGIFPCDFYVLDKYNMGNLLSQSFEQMAASPAAKQFVEESLHVDEACGKCKWQSLCRGGCRRDREPFVDGRPGLNKYCKAFSGFFEYAYPRLKELAMLVYNNRIS